ncbi:MAG: hypothetical protein GJ677_07595 [Rhodobacteraceae bacterium]|nr:hypothetical protein [Paracoccaceae bacterium]
MKKDNPVQRHIAGASCIPSTLPLTHITTLHGFRAIAAGDALVPSKCRFFNEDLLYLFYGRPSYRASQTAASKLLWNAPVGFILAPEAIGKIHRVLPFDSGAFKSGRYGRVFAPESHWADFELDTELLSAQKYVAKFFESNEQYLVGRSEVSQDVGNFDFEIQGLEYLARLNGLQDAFQPASVDERASAIEIQLKDSLPLATSILAIIVPEDILGESRFLTALDKWRVGAEKVIPYTSVLGHGSEAWVAKFFDVVLNLYREKGYI